MVRVVVSQVEVEGLGGRWVLGLEGEGGCLRGFLKEDERFEWKCVDGVFGLLDVSEELSGRDNCRNIMN